ncbi:Phosphoglycolate phosphatase [Rubripirellula amarantea]|uniref:phosphoglycolate phosphatase n=1 Tax=Rubripirellula amarantea TaxID=2527999 RepID=A0A5C5WVX2_9BACT|nr:HAD family hydrolase [Rubripirellula amarantea]TWT55104.1 Phosphoglycolate phosphatase [Rubripirellula amarantea]
MTTLLFDIDGTLLMTHNSGSGALKRAMSEEFGLVSPDVDLDFGGRTDRSILVELLTRNRIDPTPKNQERLSRRYVDLLPIVLVEHGGVLLPGVTDLLTRIGDFPEMQSYVMTGNLAQTARMKLDHFQLGDFFIDVFGGDHDEHRNDLARRAARKLRDLHGKTDHDELIVIGDTVADIECGHAIGAKVIAVATGSHVRERLEAAKPLAVVDDLSDADHLLQILNAR